MSHSAGDCLVFYTVAHGMDAFMRLASNQVSIHPIPWLTDCSVWILESGGRCYNSFYLLSPCPPILWLWLPRFLLTIDVLVLHLLCPWAETRSNQGNRTVDPSSSQGDGTVDWSREGLMCSPPIVPTVGLRTEPAEPNKWELQTSQRQRLSFWVERSASSSFPTELWTRMVP